MPVPLSAANTRLQHVVCLANQHRWKWCASCLCAQYPLTPGRASTFALHHFPSPSLSSPPKSVAPGFVIPRACSVSHLSNILASNVAITVPMFEPAKKMYQQCMTSASLSDVEGKSDIRWRQQSNCSWISRWLKGRDGMVGWKPR